MKELVFKLHYKNVSVKGIAYMEEHWEEFEVGFYHPQTGQIQEEIRNTFTGWKFQNEELNEQMFKLFDLYYKYNEEIMDWIGDYLSTIQDGEESYLELELDEEYGVDKKNNIWGTLTDTNW
mgnify:CR=1 FL=1